MTTYKLSQLLTDTAALLNDQNFSFTSQMQLTRWINRSRREIASMTGSVQRLISGQTAFGASSQPGFMIPGAIQPGAATPNANPQVIGFGADTTNSMMTIPGVERYPYVGFFNDVLRDAYKGCDSVLDAIQLAVNWGGVTRPALDWLPWDDYQAYCRAYATLVTSYPSVWTVFNDGPLGEVWMFPIPSQAGEIELTASCLPSDLNSDNDPEVIPSNFCDAIVFGAAKFAYQTSQRYAQAEVMEGEFMKKLGIERVASDKGKTQSYYGSRYY